MPKSWFYHIALILPFVFRLLILNTGFVDWLWYQHYEQAYYTLASLKVQPQFLEFIGGWKLPVFIVAILCWWHVEDGEGLPAQFLLVPLAYVPFTLIADTLANAQFPSNFYMYPLVILPIGYIYVFIWTMVIWVLGKVGLVIV